MSKPDRKTFISKLTLYIPAVIAIGIAIGIGNYAIGSFTNLGQAIIQNTITSLLIGFPLIVIAEVYTTFRITRFSKILHLIMLTASFTLIGLIGSEIEIVIRNTVFEHVSYAPFKGKGMYIFNAIIANVLGYSFVMGLTVKNKQNHDGHDLKEQITSLPLKKGQQINLLPLNELSLLVANDKFSFAITQNGEKMICDYSLSYLQQKLPPHFVRVHRKYIVNTRKIKTIEKYGKGRYSISFQDGKPDNIISSQHFHDNIKALIKL